jgi:hypothetical protein
MMDRSEQSRLILTLGPLAAGEGLRIEALRFETFLFEALCFSDQAIATGAAWPQVLILCPACLIG